MKYRKIPLEVEACFFDGSDESHEKVRSLAGDAYEVLHGDVVRINIDIRLPSEPYSFYLYVGNWIIKGIEGELYACKDSVFQKTYEKAE